MKCIVIFDYHTISVPFFTNDFFKFAIRRLLLLFNVNISFIIEYTDILSSNKKEREVLLSVFTCVAVYSEVSDISLLILFYKSTICAHSFNKRIIQIAVYIH